MRKIGIMGGTFNPIHNGHLAIAEEAKEQFGLEEIWFLPSKKPPHKRNEIIAENEMRMDMVALAIKPYPFFVMSDLEMNREGYSYTADTLQELVNRYPEDSFYFIVGSDSLHYMEKWYMPEQIFQLCTVLVAPRLPATLEADERQKEKLEAEYDAHIHFIRMEPLEIASSGLLKLFQEGQDISPFVPASVEEYIKQNKLYGYHTKRTEVPHKWDLVELQKLLKKELTPRRYVHTLGVMHTALSLAMCYGENPEKAKEAGLLHDCAKCLSDTQLLAECAKNGLFITEKERQYPYLLHGKLGAYYARKRFGVENEDILNAICYHTTGRPKMSQLEKIVFIADYIEPGRNEIPGLKEIRDIVFQNLDGAVFMALKNTIQYINETNPESLDYTAVEAYEYYKKKLRTN